MFYRDELAGGPSAVIDPLADSQIENAEAERREHDGPSAINLASPSDDRSERAGDEVSRPRELLRQMQ